MKPLPGTAPNGIGLALLKVLPGGLPAFSVTLQYWLAEPLLSISSRAVVGPTHARLSFDIRWDAAQ